MEYNQLRKDILYFLGTLQDNGFSYQSICDFINTKQSDFVLYKDFFTRFQSNDKYLKNKGKREKLQRIHQHMQHFFQQNIDEKYFTNNLLEKTVSEAAMAKFEAYLDSSPSYQSALANVARYYRENSPAFLSIEKTLKHKRQYDWELDMVNYGSSYEILSQKINELFNNNAVVTTQEFWKLWWVDKKMRRLQFSFDALGKHTYLLSKDETGSWKIIEDIGINQPNKVEPEFVDYNILEKLASKHWEDNRRIADNFLAEDELFHCIAFIKFVYGDKLSVSHTSILDRIRESCLNSYRLLNTGLISYTIFKEEKASLKKQLQPIVNTIFLSIK